MKKMYLILFFLPFFCFSQQYYTSEQILNKVFYSTSPALQGYLTESQILNTIFDNKTNALRIRISSITTDLDLNNNALLNVSTGYFYTIYVSTIYGRSPVYIPQVQISTITFQDGSVLTSTSDIKAGINLEDIEKSTFNVLISNIIKTFDLKFQQSDISLTTETIKNFIRFGAVIVAASDTPKEFKSFAHYICDGKADEEEINKAIRSGKSTIFLLPGNFYISTYSYINVNDISSITIQGSGMFSTVIKKPNVVLEGGDYNIYRWIVISSANATNITFENLCLDGQYEETNSNLLGVMCLYSKGIFFLKKIYMKNVKNRGIVNIKPQEVYDEFNPGIWYIEDCIFENIGINVIDAWHNKQVIVKGCRFSNKFNIRSGIIILPAEGSIIEGNLVKDYQSGGYFVYSTRPRVLIANNIVMNSYFWGSTIHLSGYLTGECSYNIVANNILYNVSGYDGNTAPINLGDNTWYNIISNNIIVPASGINVAIYTRGGWYWEANAPSAYVHHNFITNNYILNTQYGVWIRNNSGNDYNYISNNNAYNVSVPFRDDRGTNISRYNSWDTNLILSGTIQGNTIQASNVLKTNTIDTYNDVKITILKPQVLPVVNSLPTSGYPAGTVIYLSTDNNVYISTETVVGTQSWKPIWGGQ